MVDVSIIVPIYNVEKYLNKCIESLVEQTYKNIEIILVDDGSTDNSLECCYKWKEYDSRICVVSQINKGVSVARNRGMEVAVGKWIIFVDGDDWVSPDIVEILYSVAEDKNADIVIASYFAVQENRVYRGEYFTKDDNTAEIKSCKADYLQGNALGSIYYGATSFANIGVPWGKIYRHSFINKHNLHYEPGLKRMQDTLFNIYSFEYAKKIYMISPKVYYYRIRDSSAVNRYNSNYEIIVLEFLNHLKQFVFQIKPTKEMVELYHFKCVGAYLECARLYYMHQDCQLNLKDKIKGLRTLYNNEEIRRGINSCPGKLLSISQNVGISLIKKKLFLCFYILYSIKRRI